MTVPDVLVRFVAEFNSGRFWESHEVLEEPWRRWRSRFYHGLILYASAWVHQARGNRSGLLAQLGKADQVLTDFQPGYLGIDVTRLLEDSRRLRVLTLAHRLSDVSTPALQIEGSLIRGDEPELTDSD